MRVLFSAFIAVAAARCENAVVTALEGRLNSATYMSSPLEAGDSCTYRFQPASESSMQALVLVFEDLQCDGCEIFVYEGTTTEAQLWRCVSCGEVLPPPFYLKGLAALLTFSAPRGGMSRFSVRYLAHTDDMGERADGETYEVELKMAQGLIAAPVTARGRAPRPLLYDWKINPEDCAECGVAVYVEASQLRDGDTVVVIDGEGELARWTSDAFPGQWVFGRKGNVILQLSAPGSERETDPDFAFRARYVAAHADACHVGNYCSCGEHGPLDDVTLATAPSAILTDGSAEADNMLGPDACEWLVAPALLATSVRPALTWPPPARSAWTPAVVLVAERVSVKYEGSIRVYDGSDNTFPLLWACAGCQFTAPPPLEASGESLYVEYVSGSGSAYYTNPVTEEASEWTGWQAIYWTEGAGWTSGAGSSKVELVGGAATSVRAPFGWSGGLDYRWVLRPEVFGGTEGLLTIAWNALALSCGDVVEAYGGAVNYDAATWALAYAEGGSPPLLKTWDCMTSSLAWLVADAHEGVTLRLLSQSGSAGGTVDFAFFSDAPKYRCGHVREPAVLSAGSFVFGDGSAPQDAMAASMTCAWLVRPEPGVETPTAVSLAFYRVDLRGGRLRVYEGPSTNGTLLWDCTSCSEVPPILHARAQSLYVTLETASEPDGSGFEARYYASFENGRGVGDGEMRLGAAAAASVRAPYEGLNTLAADLDLTWRIDVSEGTVLLVANAIDLPDCATGSLTIYDGTVSNDAVLDTFCEQTPTKWLASSTPTMILRLRTSAVVEGRGFDVAYFSDRPQQGCGSRFRPNGPLDPDAAEASWWAPTTTQQRQVLRASSFLFSDGGTPDADARAAQDCEWILAPPVTGTTRVILAFPRLDLGDAGALNVTSADTGEVLFACQMGGCDEPPPPLALQCGALSYSNRCALRISYATAAAVGTDQRWGTGFLAHYFVAAAPNYETDKVLLLTPGSDDDVEAAFEEGGEAALRLGPGPTDETALPRPTAVWRSELRPEGSLSLRLDDAITLARQTVAFVDGHDAVTARAALATTLRRHCGVLNVGAVLMRERYALPAAADHLIYATASITTAWALGAGNATVAYPDCGWAAAPLADVTYVDVSFDAPLLLREGISFAVYAGDTSAGQLVMLCENCRDRVSGRECCLTTLRPVRVFCGRVLVRLYVDEGTNLGTTSLNIRMTAGPERTPRPDWERCWDSPAYIPEKPTIKEYEMSAAVIAVLVVGGFLVLVLGMSAGIVFRGSADDRRQRRRVAVASGKTQWKPAMVEAAAIAPRLQHARHFGSFLHEVQNRFLAPKGSCCICYGDNTPVIQLKQCSHDVCVDCMRSYCHAALGDISMFPLRCPMHHAGCRTNIHDVHARRVLKRQEYHKFADFYDRSVLGDGIHCLKCGCFVNLPRDGDPMVQCPYCAYRWCVRCKCPWHPNIKCSERADVELEEWREQQGAQRCPGCFKIIEKDDPESCNHMTHKLTDAMPCTRERSDFCYCCGVEISPDYPHAELDKPDIPHFPDGVFQDCRAVQLGYATMAQKRRLTGRSGRRRRDVAPLRDDVASGLFGAYFDNPQSPVAGEGFADETPAERRRRRRRERRDHQDGRPRRPRSATAAGRRRQETV